MIVYCCPDLFFATKIRAAAETLHIPTRPARDPDTLRKRLERSDDGKGNDPVTGVIIDLGLGATALEMIQQVKIHDSATPVAAYGAHMATDTLQAARTAGADFVLANSQFAANLPAILERLAGSN